MGAMSVRTPIANQQSAKSLWNMSLLWKLFTILVILQACGINAKVSEVMPFLLLLLTTIRAASKVFESFGVIDVKVYGLRVSHFGMK